jgi:hypothetical protein
VFSSADDVVIAHGADDDGNADGIFAVSRENAVLLARAIYAKAHDPADDLAEIELTLQTESEPSPAEDETGGNDDDDAA